MGWLDPVPQSGMLRRMWRKLVMVCLIVVLLLGRAPALLAMECGKVPPLTVQHQQFSPCHAKPQVAGQKDHAPVSSCHSPYQCNCQPLAMMASDISPARFVITTLTAQPAVPSVPVITQLPPERPPRHV
jgi:hypothetical protein